MIKVRVDGRAVWLECDGDLQDLVVDTEHAIHSIYAMLKASGGNESAEGYREGITRVLTDPQSATWVMDDDVQDVWTVDMAELKRQMEEGQ